MKILIIDDSTKNIEAAKSQLADHELITATTFNEGRIAIDNSHIDSWSIINDLASAEDLPKKESEIKKQLKAKHPNERPGTWMWGSHRYPEYIKSEYDELYAPIKERYSVLKNIASERFTYLSGHKFDVVLTDLMMPGSANKMGDEGQKYIGQQMPLGDMLLLAALKAGVKKVALVTDSNHHDHPAVAAIDMFGKAFVLGDTKILLVNDAIIRSESGEYTKDWCKALDQLLENE